MRTIQPSPWQVLVFTLVVCSVIVTHTRAAGGTLSDSSPPATDVVATPATGLPENGLMTSKVLPVLIQLEPIKTFVCPVNSVMVLLSVVDEFQSWAFSQSRR